MDSYINVSIRGRNVQMWAPLLRAETINEGVIARASAKNPQGAKRLQELEQIRELHASVARNRGSRGSD